MTDIGKLVDALCEAYDNPKLKAEANGKTHCDETVHYVLSRFGFEEFAGDEWMADSIIAFMRNSLKFKRVDGSLNAQAFANAGSLVIAGLTSKQLGQEHGHVAIIRPGVMEESGIWKKKAPKVMSNGSGAATTISKRLSYVFRSEPEYYALVSTL